MATAMVHITAHMDMRMVATTVDTNTVIAIHVDPYVISIVIYTEVFMAAITHVDTIARHGL